MKILLVNPPDDMETMLGAGAKLITPFEPLGLLYIAAVAREAGYEVQVMDAWVERLSKEDFKREVERIKPDVIGFTVFTANGGVVYDLGQWIKEALPDTVVVLGNLHAAIYAEQYLRNACCDLIVHGEGEFPFIDALRVIESGSRDFSKIASISFLKDGEFVRATEQGVVSDLTALPFPARDLVKQDLGGIHLTGVNRVRDLALSRPPRAVCPWALQARGMPSVWAARGAPSLAVG